MTGTRLYKSCLPFIATPDNAMRIFFWQGRFEIISLSGSFLLAEDGDTRSRTGGLSVALAGSDGRVLGGCVAGMLMAATPVQVRCMLIFFLTPARRHLFGCFTSLITWYLYLCLTGLQSGRGG
jgi:hypothetical protein